MSLLKTAEHYIGKTFNHWTILVARPNKLKGMVLARCSCGKECITRLRSLKNGTSKSCGCKRVEYAKRGKRLESNNTALNKCFSQYRAKATRQKQEFKLDLTQFQNLTSSNCYYCGDEPSALYKTKYDLYKYNGIDRVNNDNGYTIDNSVTCCYSCNTKKGAVTLHIINKILEFINGK